MKLTITVKRQMVVLFKEGKTVTEIARLAWYALGNATKRESEVAAEQVLRDYMLGKFQLQKREGE